MKIHCKYILIALLLVVPFAGCKKDLLDQQPTSQLSTTVLWKQPSDADLILAGCYSTLLANTSGFGVDQFLPYAWDSYSDDIFDTNGFAGQTALNNGINATTSRFVNDTYINAYKAIAYINYFLANVDKVLTGDQLKQYKAEAYFLRGFYYFLLAQTYGNVIITTNDYIGSGDYTEPKEKSPRSEVMKQVDSDLDLAIAGLPDVAYGSGRAVKGTAQGYKVRALLVEKKYQEAAALASAIIGSNKFSLNQDYSANFYKPGQNSSPEIMFSVKFGQPNVSHPGPASLTSQLLTNRNFQATQDLINEYEMANGRFVNEAGSGYDPAKPAENRDPRLRRTFFFAGDTKAQGWPFTGSKSVAKPGDDFWIVGFYLIKKWVDPSLIDPTFPVRDETDLVLLRFADVRLMYAEAQNEAVGPDAAVYQQVNDVRARVSMPPLPAGLSQAQMRDRIRHERRVELAVEGLRYFDLRRWGIAIQKLNGFVQNPVFPNVKTKYEEKYDFWPIPQTEIDRNATALTQNPGY